MRATASAIGFADEFEYGYANENEPGYVNGHENGFENANESENEIGDANEDAIRYDHNSRDAGVVADCLRKRMRKRKRKPNVIAIGHYWKKHLSSYTRRRD